jgi:hypothetical protein
MKELLLEIWEKTIWEPGAAQGETSFRCLFPRRDFEVEQE